jgi:phage tail-like protein
MAAVNRFDPYKNFKFVVKFGNTVVAGVSKVSGLKKTTEVVKHREGADPSTSRKSPGRTEFDAITLERGVTADREFEKWANQVWFFQAQAPTESALKNFRRDITIELRNESGQPVMRYFVFRCWVSEYQGLPDLDANANAIALEHVKIENEGWRRDPALTIEAEPEFAGDTV